ncbi:hypothetical protein B0H63DRAFT_456111 [Podospora didyma]|uniref:Uncharacterized protein n=1 Tax=Podospora didyma TaxID=330526 RepID=A0AAE0N147_9PEZI|nr:hypothetical protein B0H63DRAFT_456111 [Podospora didyma]
MIEWANGKKEKPVFPQWTSEGPKEKARETTSLGHQAADWARRANFTASFGLHSARRTALINGNDNGYSLGQLLKLASQSNTHALINHYLGNVSSIDGASNYLGTERQTELAEDFLSATMRRNPEEELKTSQEYVSLERQIENLILEVEAATLGDTRTELKAQRKILYDQRRVFKKKALQKYQEDQKLAYETPKNHEQGDWRQGHFDRICHAMKGIAGNLWKHVFDRYKDFHMKRSGFASFCFRCDKWRTSEPDRAADCQSHIDNNDVPFRCNPVKFRKATVCAGYCPVHLGRADFPAHQRLRQFLEQSS